MAADQSGLSVSELNLLVAEAIRRDPRTRSVTVRGEVSGFKHHIASGHWYFSLKDEMASVNCVMFRSSTLRASLRPADGVSVVVTGYVDVYPRTGSYQLYVTSLRAGGLGDLYLQFEALKQKLQAEGLFDPSRKKPLPMLPRKVAVVTSESGAALHDILNVSRMRCPFVPIVLIPVAVQGAEAGREIAGGIRRANTLQGVDVIIVGRGGGSPEDLWCFNDERVARAVAESALPVVSGVGHEVDTTICDLAADVRASTPSNAAEIVFPEVRELRERVNMLRAGLVQAAERGCRGAELRLSRLRETLGRLSPERRLQHLAAQRAGLSDRLEHVTRLRLQQEGTLLRMTRERMENVMTRRLDRAAAQVDRAGERLRGISPTAVLNRGYAMVYSENEELITRAAEAARRSRMRIRFADGPISVVREEESHESGDGAGDRAEL